MSRCKDGKSNGKFNYIVYNITLNNGELIANVPGSIRCQYKFEKPLLMRVTFKDGKVVDVLTDGSELAEPIAYARQWIADVSEKVLGVDRGKNPSAYGNSAKSKQEILNEWKK